MPYPDDAPNTGQGYGPSPYPMGLYRGEQIYSEWFKGNYWIAYILSEGFVGAGATPELAETDFLRTAGLVLGST